jgi:hypothetical protein
MGDALNILNAGGIEVLGGATLVDPGATPGDVLTIQSDGSVAAESGGGSVPGANILRGPFAINYNTADLAAGIDFYTPTPGDVLVSAAVITNTAFDGTTPTLDIGCDVSNGDVGVLDKAGGPTDLSSAPLVAGNQNVAVWYPLNAVFADDSPLQVWASQDGTKDGTAIGGTEGVASLWITTATPVAL